MHLPRLIFLAVLWELTFSTAAAPSEFGGETIREFDAWIEVRADGSLDVTEVILVNAEGQQIKRGIYRDFPTTTVPGTAAPRCPSRCAR